MVTAVIALLTALLFPAFAKEQEKARQASCASNMRQLNIGFLQYVQDNDESLPGVFCCGDGAANKPGGWVAYSAFPVNRGAGAYDVTQGSVFPYVKSKAVYVCPDDGGGRRMGDSYAVNSCTVNPRPAIGLPYPGEIPASFNNPAVLMLLGEEAAFGPGVSGTDDASFRFRNNPFSTRHTGGPNVALLDGHAKWYRPERAHAEHLQSPTPDGSDCPG